MRSRAKIESRLALADPALGRVIDAVIARIGPQRIAPSRTAPFEALVRAVVYQSIAATAAEPIHARLKQAAGAPLTPKKVLALRAQSLARAGLSKAKARTIRGLAEWFADHQKLAKKLPALSDTEILATLTSLPGIGAWTVNVFVTFNLG